jgi:hypothetical protein
LGEVRTELLHLVEVDAVPDQAVGEEAPRTLQAQTGLKVPKHEIFDVGFFASKEPIWSPDSEYEMVLNINSNSQRYSIK